MTSRHYNRLDDFVHGLDQALHTVFGPAPRAGRPYPAENTADTELTTTEREHAARLMRVNHAGEVCAQALYQGQALTARNEANRETLERASDEENDHLAWTSQRVSELGGRLSLLNPAWYAGSFTIGAAAGLAGDRWSLGFLAETERQVVAHLDSHLKRLPEQDARSRVIVSQMRDDEGRHATTAIEAGGSPLPIPVRRLMKMASGVMTRIAHRI
jgi:ubiquinone biosynthesis monooxygenase Coq7